MADDEKKTGPSRVTKGNVTYVNFGGKSHAVPENGSGDSPEVGSEVGSGVGPEREGGVAKGEASEENRPSRISDRARQRIRERRLKGSAATAAEERYNTVVARLESFKHAMTDEGRIERGKAYFDNGMVGGFEVGNARMEAAVEGSQINPFNVWIHLPYMEWPEVQGIIEEFTLTPNAMEEARKGFVSETVLDKIFGTDPEDIDFFCNCPDNAHMCKHAVAVLERAQRTFQADPLKVFDLRGIRTDQLERAILGKAGAKARENETDPVLFWQGHPMPDLPTPKVAPIIDDADPTLLNKAMRMVSYTHIDTMRAVADIEDIYDFIVFSDGDDYTPDDRVLEEKYEALEVDEERPF